MDLSLNPEQQALRAEVREFLTQNTELAELLIAERSETHYDEELFRAFARRGWLQFGLPGFAGGVLELCLVLEEVGRSACPGPFQNGAVQCGLLLGALANQEQRGDWLAPLLDGRRRASLCVLEADGQLAPSSILLRAEPVDGGFELSGLKQLVPYAGTADEFYVVARTRDGGPGEDCMSLLRVEARLEGIHIRPQRGVFDDGAGAVEFCRVRVGGEALVGELHRVWPVLEDQLLVAAVALCAEMNGGAQAALDLAVAHARQREQFGRPVGAFQAVAHRAADCLVEVDACRLAVAEAASRIDAGLDFAEAASAAKALCAVAYPSVTAAAHQIHGGVGYYEDSRLHLYTRRAEAMAQALGDASHHLERIACLWAPLPGRIARRDTGDSTWT
ncbi:acyl-CoA dehydrogenase [Myxococcota bacterium]|nr:acyl-CoA dehydrogenase [Myxococcota bacterium]